MAKKVKKKSPVVLRSEIGLVGVKEVIQVVESYSTIKRRLLTSEVFIEVTTRDRRKFLKNKMNVDYVMPLI